MRLLAASKVCLGLAMVDVDQRILNVSVDELDFAMVFCVAAEAAMSVDEVSNHVENRGNRESHDSPGCHECHVNHEDQIDHDASNLEMAVASMLVAEASEDVGCSMREDRFALDHPPVVGRCDLFVGHHDAEIGC